jgi:hypothetical protein
MEIKWAVENVRLSLFSKGTVVVTDADWKALTGQQEADTRQNVPGGRTLRRRTTYAGWNDEQSGHHPDECSR